jgi:hypothetical protein
VSGLRAGTYTVTPSLSGYQFSPTTTSVSLGPDTNNVNFTAAGTLSISGRVTESGNGISGLWITNRYATTSGALVTTNTTTAANGSYVFNSLRPRNYTLSPEQTGVGFTPTATMVNLSNSATVNFTANGARLQAWLTNQEIRLRGFGLPLRSYLVQSATNVSNPSTWETVPGARAADTNGFFEFLEPVATNRPAKFYRTTVP